MVYSEKKKKGEARVVPSGKEKEVDREGEV